MEPNFAGSIYRRSFIMFVHFIPIRTTNMAAIEKFLNSDWLSFQKSSPQKLLGQMKPNFAGSIYGRSFIKIVHFMSRWDNKHGWPWAILNSDWLTFQKSSPPETTWPIGTKLCRKHLWEVLYKVCSFCSDQTTNVVAIGNS